MAEYSHKDIKQVEAIKHIQLNPSMYISTTENISHLIEEALDNSLDEAQAGHANIIAVVCDSENNEYSIMDNGRGIPIEKDVPITVSTKMFSGAKFSGMKQAYKISCFTGITKVKHPTISKSFSNLKDLCDPATIFTGLAYDQQTRQFIKRNMMVKKTGQTNHFYIITLSNGCVECCTPEHLWLVVDKENEIYMAAQDLVEGTIIKSVENQPLVVTDSYKFKTREPVDVFDIISPIESNFVLNSGAVVHNSGLHGIGLVAIYALSKKYSVEIYRNKKHAIFSFEEGKLVNKKINKFDSEPPFSTKISFIPDEKYFTNPTPDYDRIRARMNFASVAMPDLVLVLIKDGEKEVIKCDLDSYFENEVKSLSDTNTTPRIDISVKHNDDYLNLSFCYSFDGPITPKNITSVNLLPIRQNGSHVSYFQEILKKYFLDKAKKNKAKEYKFQNGDVLIGLRCFFSFGLVNPKFLGQSKEKLENSKKQLEPLMGQIYEQLDQYFSNNKNILDELLDHFHNYRLSIESKKVKPKKSVSKKFTKLRDCKDRNGELFVVEGESAAGGIIQSRGSTSSVAILPLKGKIPSVVNKKDILNNLEVQELFMALGTGVEPNFNIHDMRYNKLICCCDADPDGGHIAVLLTMIIAVLAPEIIKKGRYYIANTPLYGTWHKKEFIPLWTNKQIDDAMKSGLKVTRFKGLGEFNPADLRECLLNPNKRNLTKIEWNEECLGYLSKLLKDANEKRKLVEDIETDYQEYYEKIDNFIKHNYRRYGNHVNMERMIPLYADGLRPVERRVLYSAYEIAREKFAKSATIVGHAMRYHMHGDSSIYGTLCQLVNQKFMEGQGNFGTNLGVEKIGAAASRYTEARLARKISMAFELMKYTPMIDGETQGIVEPLYIPTPVPFCLFGENYINGIGFGVKTMVPTYEIDDLLKRLTWLLGQRKTEPIIYPRTFGCQITKPKGDENAKNLLTTGNGVFEYKGVVEVDKRRKIAVIRAMPPNISFNKIEKAVLGKDFSYMDRSSGDVGTFIEFWVDRKRDVNKLFDELVQTLNKVLTTRITFTNYQIDSNNNDKFVLRIMSVDEMLLKTYQLYKKHFEDRLGDNIEKIKKELYILSVLEKIKIHIRDYLNKSQAFDDVVIAKELAEKIKEPEDIILNILRKYTLSRILKIKLDRDKLDENLKELNKIMENVVEHVYVNYKQFCKMVKS